MTQGRNFLANPLNSHNRKDKTQNQEDESAAEFSSFERLCAPSPYLTRLMRTEDDFVRVILRDGFDTAFTELLKTAYSSLKCTDERIELEKGLRLLKRRAALLTALADLSGEWNLTHVTQALSILAEACIRMAAAFVLRRAYEKGELALPDPERPEENSGFIILAMGKLGARELNYSSDVDLIVLYDEEKTPYCGKRDIGSFFVRLTREIIALLEERTPEGYVFRTDLRLRPDPGSTPAALGTAAAVCYYESFAQNWERAAFIKARVIAGDKAAGNAFLKEIRPFIWRRSSDFYVLQQIHDIKKSSGIRSGGELRMPGHNIKLGEGGIREIEFFTQLQQLLWGGRDTRLRLRGTLNALGALEKAGWVAASDRAALSEAYVFLRTVEHRLQMTDDEQTQTLPKTPEELERLSVFCGFPSWKALEEALKNRLETVRRAYDGLFAGEEASCDDEGLSFGGADIPVGTAERLHQMGFRRPDFIGDSVRGWLSGRYRALRSDKARALLQELLPAVFKALSRTENADAAFARFDDFLKGLPSGVQIFSLFQSRPALLDLLAEIMSAAPPLAAGLARRPELFDAVLAPDFFQPLPLEAKLTEEAAETIAAADGVEQALDAARRFVREKKFRGGVHFLRGLASGKEAGRYLADLASAVLKALCPVVREDFEKRYGRIPDSSFSLVLMGKAGSGEMNFLSDLDILFIYDTPGDAVSEGGSASLSAGVYFARLAQRMINAITANTKEGQLWPVDMRLRPSGSAGPAAVSFDAFRRYYAESAWTWEYMALTKARIAWGGAEKTGPAVTDILRSFSGREKLRADAAAMRGKIRTEHPGTSVWDLKYAPGGMVDIEFETQCLQLENAAEFPGILRRSVGAVLDAASEKKCLAGEARAALKAAYDFRQELSVLFSLCLEDGRFEPQTAPEEVRQKLCRFCALPNLEAVEDKLRRTAKEAGSFLSF
jgi:glutamate-ammonia-ligase adenylyltransferase